MIVLLNREASERTFHCQLILNKRSDTGYILKVGPRGLTVGTEVGCAGSQGAKGDSNIFGLSNWRSGVTTNETVKTRREGLVEG